VIASFVHTISSNACFALSNAIPLCLLHRRLLVGNAGFSVLLSLSPGQKSNRFLVAKGY
jgi:hypothetical protein